MGPRVFHAKFQPDRPKGVGLTTSGGQQLLGELEILDRMRCATYFSRHFSLRFCHRKREDAIVISYIIVYC